MEQKLSDERRPIFTVDLAARLAQNGNRRLRILMLADDAHPADAVIDHIDSIRMLSQHDVTVVNPIIHRSRPLISWLQFDVIIIHYSICILYEYFLPARVADGLKKFRGPKIQIIQDEYRWIDRMARRMWELGVGAVFSSLSVENIRRVYHHEHLAEVRFVSGLPGYVSRRLHKIPPRPLESRVYDLVYRGRPLPIWLGKFSQEKSRIGIQAMAMAKKYNLNVNCGISEEERVYGVNWNELLVMGRAALATQGGATVFDFDETVEQGVGRFRLANPNASDDEIWDAVVKLHDGKIVHKTITPRVFEAVMNRTALVMYPGEYRGLLQPWEHYIPLERNGSNEAEVVHLLRDHRRLGEMIERAYRRVADDPALQFSRYVGAVDGIASALDEEIWARRGKVDYARSYINRATVRLVVRVGERCASRFNESSARFLIHKSVGPLITVGAGGWQICNRYLKTIIGFMVHRLVKR